MRMLSLLAAAHFELVGACGAGPLGPPIQSDIGTQLRAGGQVGCRLEAGRLRCFGSNDKGALGINQTSASAVVPTAVTLPWWAADITVGAQSACARSTDGRIACWGALSQSADAGAFNSAPVEVELPVPALQVDLRFRTALALGSDGRTYGWGSHREGNLGRGDQLGEVDVAPVNRAAFAQRFTTISAGQGHSCGVDTEGALWCWGRNTGQELGANLPDPQYRTPQRILADSVREVAAGLFLTCAIRLNGALWCWGRLLDDSGRTLTFPFGTVMALPPVKRVECDWFHACALTEGNELYWWGRGIEGQLGSGSPQAQARPQRVATEVTDFTLSDFSTCIRTTQGVSCTGHNEAGELGVGDTNRRSGFTAQGP